MSSREMWKKLYRALPSSLVRSKKVPNGSMRLQSGLRNIKTIPQGTPGCCAKMGGSTMFVAATLCDPCAMYAARTAGTPVCHRAVEGLHQLATCTVQDCCELPLGGHLPPPWWRADTRPTSHCHIAKFCAPCWGSARLLRAV